MRPSRPGPCSRPGALAGLDDVVVLSVDPFPALSLSSSSGTDRAARTLLQDHRGSVFESARIATHAGEGLPERATGGNACPLHTTSSHV
ncbi:hypothetical protein MTO96_035788 [Rhipicephalus appendiculatus]